VGDERTRRTVTKNASRLSGEPSPYDVRQRAKAAAVPDGPLARRWRREEDQIAEIVAAIRGGAHVAVDRLALLLSDGCPLPQDVRVYIAGRLDGSITRTGRPTDPSSSRSQPEWKYAISIERATIARAERDNAKAIRELDKAIGRERLKAEYDKVRAEMWRLKRERRPEYKKRCKEFTLQYPGTEPAQLAYAVLARRHNSTRDGIRRALLKPARRK
jgi:hypothetical protein